MLSVTRLWTAWPLALALTLPSACTPLPPVVSKEPHFDFATDAPDRACTGNLIVLDTLIEMLEDQFNIDTPHFTFYWLPDGQLEDLAPCSSDGPACFRPGDGAIYSSFLPATHEVVHAVFAEHDLHPFLDEGIANLMQEATPSTHEPTVTIRDVLSYDGESADYPDSYRGRGAHFLRFLIDRHGFERVGTLLKASSPKVDLNSHSELFEESLGEPLSDLLVAYETAPLCPLVESRFAMLECGSPTIPRDVVESRWDATIQPDCSAMDTLGRVDATHWTPRTIEIDTAGSYEVSVNATLSGRAEVVLGRCGGGCEQGVYVRIAEGQSATVDLSEGLHYLLIVQHEDAADPIDLNVRRTDG